MFVFQFLRLKHDCHIHLLFYIKNKESNNFKYKENIKLFNQIVKFGGQKWPCRQEWVNFWRKAHTALPQPIFQVCVCVCSLCVSEGGGCVCVCVAGCALGCVCVCVRYVKTNFCATILSGRVSQKERFMDRPFLFFPVQVQSNFLWHCLNWWAQWEISTSDLFRQKLRFRFFLQSGFIACVCVCVREAVIKNMWARCICVCVRKRSSVFEPLRSICVCVCVLEVCVCVCVYVRIYMGAWVCLGSAVLSIIPEAWLWMCINPKCVRLHGSWTAYADDIYVWKQYREENQVLNKCSMALYCVKLFEDIYSDVKWYK